MPVTLASVVTEYVSLALAGANLVVVIVIVGIYREQARQLAAQTIQFTEQTRTLVMQSAIANQEAECLNRTNLMTASHSINGTMHAVNRVCLAHPELHGCFYREL